jgi:two-component system cell cycle response regulator
VRYGGDEFLLILPGASKEDVKKAGERIRNLVRESVIREMDQEIRVTISMGIAEYLGDEINNANELVNKADSRLYEAKGVGRDRVVAE